MMVYIIAFVLSWIFAKIYIYNKEKYLNTKCKLSKKLLVGASFLLMIFPLWFISAFRYDVGTDYFNTYVKYFEHTKLGWKPYSEVLFQGLNDLLVYLNCDVVWLFIITSFVFLFFIFKTIVKNSENIFQSLIILFVSSIFFSSLNNVRQYVGLAIGLYGLMSTKNVKAIIFIIIGSMIHMSVILFLPFIFLKKLVFNKSSIIILTIFLLMSSPILCYIIRVILMNTKYNYFINIENSGYPLLYIIVNFIILFFSLLYFKNKDEKMSFLVLMQIFSCVFCLCSMFLQNEELWMRIIRITSIFQILLIPKLCTSIKYRLDRRVVFFSILTAYGIYTIYTVYLMGGLAVFPYTFVFGR